MKRWLPSAICQGLVSGLMASCALDNNLGGSLSESFPLDVSRVEVAENAEAMQITYFYNRGVFLDVVVRLSISLQDQGVAPDGGVPSIPLKAGTKLALQGEAPGGVLRCSVSHAPGGEPVRMLPRIKKGDLVITEGGGIGQNTKGHFSMLFEQEGGDVGLGRTLFGNFTGAIRDAGFGDLP